jgi:rhodanese-related sulfurtransferase
MDGVRPLAIYDLRPDSLFEVGRIPGSIHVRGMGLADFSQTLPPDPEAPVVFVSEDGSREPGSPDRAAAEAGYIRVLWLEGGYLAWKAVGYPTAGSRTFPR